MCDEMGNLIGIIGLQGVYIELVLRRTVENCVRICYTAIYL